MKNQFTKTGNMLASKIQQSRLTGRLGFEFSSTNGTNAKPHESSRHRHKQGSGL